MKILKLNVITVLLEMLDFDKATKILQERSMNLATTKLESHLSANEFAVLS